MPLRAAANRDFVSTFYRVGRRVEFLKIGDRYCNRRAGRLAEIAEITRLSTDAAGIMHAHFDLNVYCMGRRDPVGHRSLALASFLDNFSTRLAPSPDADTVPAAGSEDAARDDFPLAAAEVPVPG